MGTFQQQSEMQLIIEYLKRILDVLNKILMLQQLEDRKIYMQWRRLRICIANNNRGRSTYDPPTTVISRTALLLTASRDVEKYSFLHSLLAA